MSDYTEIVVVLDRSGSMQSAKADHEGGLRSFVKDQQDLSGDVRFTLIQFDDKDPCEVVYDGTPVAEVKDITLTPRGGTPLLDAVGKAIAHVDSRLKGKHPDQVVVMIVTDGGENASREWTRKQIQDRIAELEKREWKFLYLGANVDAFAEAGNLGIVRTAAMGFANNSHGVAAMYHSNTRHLRSSREYAASVKARGGQVDYDAMKSFFEYSDEDRAASAANPGGPDKQKDAQWKSS